MDSKEFVLDDVWHAILPKYQPLVFIGKGGYGEIVKCWDTEAKRDVAIKYLKCEKI